MQKDCRLGYVIGQDLNKALSEKAHKHKELFDHYYQALIARALRENHNMNCNEWIKKQAINLTEEYFKGIDEVEKNLSADMEKSKQDHKSDVVDKLHQMAFDSIREAIGSLNKNENDMCVYNLKKSINFIKCKTDVQYSNSPWDPR